MTNIVIFFEETKNFKKNSKIIEDTLRKVFV